MLICSTCHGEVTVVEGSPVLQSSDGRLIFLVFTMFRSWFLYHVYNMFDKMFVRQRLV
jgi:hypothetical protein